MDYFSKNLFLFIWSKKVINTRDSMMVNTWWENFHFWMEYQLLTICYNIVLSYKHKSRKASQISPYAHSQKRVSLPGRAQQEQSESRPPARPHAHTGWACPEDPPCCRCVEVLPLCLLRERYFEINYYFQTVLKLHTHMNRCRFYYTS